MATGTPVFAPGKFHGPRSLGGYSPGVAKSRTQLSDSHSVPVISLLIMSSSFIDVGACVRISFLLKAEIFHCMNTPCFVYPLISLLAFVDNVWAWVQQYLFKTLPSALSSVHPQMELHESHGNLFSIYWETAILFPTTTPQLVILIRIFLMIIVMLRIFAWAHLNVSLEREMTAQSLAHFLLRFFISLLSC